jgi:putative multiple sugar transport system substrate-binding protein
MAPRRWLSGAVSAVLLLTAAGCASTVDFATAAEVSHGVIGIAMPTKDSPRWIADGENMVKQFALLGYESSLVYSDNTAPTQVTQVQAMITAGDVALVIAAVDGSALTGVVANAASAKIPVLAYDRLIRGTADVNYYASFDNLKVGVLQANYIVNALRLRSRSGSANIELFAGSSDDNNSTFFWNGSMQVLRPYIRSGKLKVPSGETAFAKAATAGWDGGVAQKRMARLLAGRDKGVHVDAVLSPYDGISRGILTALKSSGYGTSKKLPVLTGQDAELDSVKLIVSGQQSETIYKDTRELAKVAVQMVNSVLTGGTPEVNDTTQYNNGVKVVPAFLLQPVSVTKSNYRRVLVDGGYYTSAEIGS